MPSANRSAVWLTSKVGGNWAKAFCVPHTPASASRDPSVLGRWCHGSSLGEHQPFSPLASASFSPITASHTRPTASLPLPHPTRDPLASCLADVHGVHVDCEKPRILYHENPRPFHRCRRHGRLPLRLVRRRGTAACSPAGAPERPSACIHRRLCAPPGLLLDQGGALTRSLVQHRSWPEEKLKGSQRETRLPA